MNIPLHGDSSFRFVPGRTRYHGNLHQNCHGELQLSLLRIINEGSYDGMFGVLE